MTFDLLGIAKDLIRFQIGLLEHYGHELGPDPALYRALERLADWIPPDRCDCTVGNDGMRRLCPLHEARKILRKRPAVLPSGETR